MLSLEWLPGKESTLNEGASPLVPSHPPAERVVEGGPRRPEVREALDKVRAAHTTQSPAKLAVPGTSEGVERT